MSRLDLIRLIPRVLHLDERGWLVKVIDGTEERLPATLGEVYVTMALPGQSRGNHYHTKTSEWFTVVVGSAEITVIDPTSGETRCHSLTADSPVTIYIPSGIGHIFTNPTGATESMILIAYADRPYDPNDTILLDLTP